MMDADEAETDWERQCTDDFVSHLYARGLRFPGRVAQTDQLTGEQIQQILTE